MSKLWLLFISVVLLAGCQNIEQNFQSAPVSNDADKTSSAAFSLQDEGCETKSEQANQNGWQYINYEQLEEVVFAPLATAEYSLEKVNYYPAPSPRIIKGLQIVNPYATICLDGQTLTIEKDGQCNQWDIAALMRGNLESAKDVYEELNAFHEWEFWFYQQDQYVTLFFRYNDVYENDWDIYITQLDLQNIEISAHQKINIGDSVYALQKTDGHFYILSEMEQLNRFFLYALTETDLTVVQESNGHDFAGYRDIKLEMRGNQYWITGVDIESGQMKESEIMDIIITA